MDKTHIASRMINRIFDMDLRDACVSNLCLEAKEYGLYGVQVFPVMIGHCRRLLQGTGIKTGAVIAYPHGIFPPELKIFEAKDCIDKGADELVVSMHCIALKSNQEDKVDAEMKAVRKALPNHTIKFILENEFLKDEEIKTACILAMENRIDVLVTSTGLYNTLDEHKNDVPIKTTAREIELMRGVVGDKVKIQAQGNIDSAAMAETLIDSGADFISTRYAAKILTGEAIDHVR